MLYGIHLFVVPLAVVVVAVVVVVVVDRVGFVVLIQLAELGTFCCCYDAVVVIETIVGPVTTTET